MEILTVRPNATPFVLRMSWLARWVIAAGAVTLLFRVGAAAAANAVLNDDQVEYSIKGAYLFNFTRFVEWPTQTRTAGEPFVIGLFGCEGSAVNAIRDTLSGKRTGDGRPIVVRDFSEATAELANCQLVFVGETGMAQVQAVQEVIGAKPVLIVGDTEGAASRGCAINFVVAGDAVRIEINLQRAERAGLKLSGRLANVARLVRDAQTN
jgi:hypothetical protein